MDLRNRIGDVNPAASNILGLSAAKVMGGDFQNVMGAKAAPLAGNRGAALLKHYEEREQANEEVSFGEGPESRHYDMALSTLHDGRGKRTRHLVVLHEITERKLAVEKLDRQANYDATSARATPHSRISSVSLWTR